MPAPDLMQDGTPNTALAGQGDPFAALTAAFALGRPALALEALFSVACAGARPGQDGTPPFQPGMAAACQAMLDHAAAHLPAMAVAENGVAGNAGVENGGAKNGGRPENVHIVTDLSAASGHRTLLEQIIRSRPQDRHVVLFTGTLSGVSRFALGRMADLGVRCHAPPGSAAVLWDKWLWLRATLADLAPLRVFLLHHPEDVLAALLGHEIAPVLGPRLVLWQQGDAIGCFGAGLPGATHLAFGAGPPAVLRAEGALRAGIPDPKVALLPLFFDPQTPLLRLC
ncbi:MAG: hypothetical protein U1D06_14790, partial [Paracoccaceae bacterium]|nr:hypothetical protein [Paracoccaceae bacterium]